MRPCRLDLDVLLHKLEDPGDARPARPSPEEIVRVDPSKCAPLPWYVRVPLSCASEVPGGALEKLIRDCCTLLDVFGVQLLKVVI